MTLMDGNRSCILVRLKHEAVPLLERNLVVYVWFYGCAACAAAAGSEASWALPGAVAATQRTT